MTVAVTGADQGSAGPAVISAGTTVRLALQQMP